LTTPGPILPLLDENKFLHLPVNLHHAMAMRDLPPIHKDPFDRQLVAQCRAEGMTLVTHDQVLAEYEIPLLPA
jgi:PIN domain nuclease of toxin-antitoxin system